MARSSSSDLDEYLYSHRPHDDEPRKRNGKLAGLKGLIVGGMTEMKDNPTPFGRTAEEIIAEAVAEYDYPVVYGFPVTSPTTTRSSGREVTLNVTEKWNSPGMSGAELAAGEGTGGVGEDRLRTPSVERPYDPELALPLRSCGGRHRLRKRRHAGFHRSQDPRDSYLTEPIQLVPLEATPAYQSTDGYLKERTRNGRAVSTSSSSCTTPSTRIDHIEDAVLPDNLIFSVFRGSRGDSASCSFIFKFMRNSRGSGTGQGKGTRGASRNSSPRSGGKDVRLPGNCASRTPAEVFRR